MRNNIHIVIMAGGTGTRFWPYSREAKPKQFLDVMGTGRSLLQTTFDRFLNITDASNIWIVSNDKYQDLIQDQLPEIPKEQVLLEPQKRNTAPCVAYAAYKIKKKDPNAVMVVSPADHLILKEIEFNKVITTAIKGATSSDNLLTIGIKPNRPETGYGYIQFLENKEGEMKKVKTFTEKPELELAKKFLKSGDFLWNSGIFIWSANAIISAFEQFDEETAQIFSNGDEYYFTEKEDAFIQEAYGQCKNISIDYAIMEKAANVFVVPGDFGWTDLGSWNALHEIREQDENQNVIEGNVLTYESTNNYIKIPNKKLAVVHGLEGFLVADFEDVLLICKKEESSVIKKFLADVKSEKGEKFV